MSPERPCCKSKQPHSNSSSRGFHSFSTQKTVRRTVKWRWFTDHHFYPSNFCSPPVAPLPNYKIYSPRSFVAVCMTLLLYYWTDNQAYTISFVCAHSNPTSFVDHRRTGSIDHSVGSAGCTAQQGRRAGARCGRAGVEPDRVREARNGHRRGAAHVSTRKKERREEKGQELDQSFM